MDFSGRHVVFSSMEAEDLDEMSEEDEDDEDDACSQEPEEEPLTLRDRFLKARFEQWLCTHSGHESSCTLLRELFMRLEIMRRDVDLISSERRFSLDFRLNGLSGRYDQKSQADTTSSLWVTKGTELCLAPNLLAELQLDGHLAVRRAHFSQGPRESSGAQEVCHVDEDMLEQCFGSETVSQLGGHKVLLQFLGTVCADSAAAAYADALPFGIPASIVAVADESTVKTSQGEDKAATTKVSSLVKKAASLSPQNLLKRSSESVPGGYPGKDASSATSGPGTAKAPATSRTRQPSPRTVRPHNASTGRSLQKISPAANGFAKIGTGRQVGES
jgi:hypothetical protein